MNIKSYTWLVSLSSCLAFASCEKEEVEAITSKDNMVEIDLAFSLGDEEADAATRMSAAVTQQTTNQAFRGLDYVRLVPFNSTSNPPIVDDDAVRLRKNNVFLQLANTYNNNKNRVYSSMLMPSTTNALLVYAWPNGGGVNAQPADKFVYGSLVSNGLEDGTANDLASGITFNLDKIWDDDSFASFDEFKQTAQAVATYLSNVANATVGGQPLYQKTGDIGILFSALSNDGHPFPYGRQFIQQKLKDLRDYSYPVSQNVKSVINTNYSKLDKEGAWKGLSDMDNYPNGLFLLKWEDATHNFVLLDAESSKTVINPSIVNPKYLTYPAQLWYHTNSPIHTSDAELANNVFNPSKWSNVLNNENFTPNGTVVNGTKVVAIDNVLQYAVGRLETKVRAATSKLPNLSDLNFLQFRGVFVTHQYKVDYNFQPLTTDNTEDDDPYYILYDREVKKNNGSVITVPANNNSDANNTLVLPSKAGEKVYVMVEFFYNGDAPKNGILTGYKGNPILPQTYFYMVGELDPGLDANNQPRQAFESDKVTKLIAKIQNFEGAYNYVPDLSSPSLILSLKLELQWEQTEPNSVWLH